jgi:hypothetical protein
VLLDEVLFVLAQELTIDMRRWRLAAAKFLKAVAPGEELTLEHALGEDTVHFTVSSGAAKTLVGSLSQSRVDHG